MMAASPPTTASATGNLRSSSQQPEAKLKPRSGKKRSKNAKKKTTDEINSDQNGNPNGKHADKKPRRQMQDLLFDNAMGFLNVEANETLKNGFELLDEADKEEFAERWESLHIAELKLVKEKAELVVDQTSLILEVLSTHSNPL